MVLEYTLGFLATRIQDILKITRNQALVFIAGLMVLNTEVSGSKIAKKVLENISTLTSLTISVSTATTNQMAWALTPGQTVTTTKVNGFKV